MEKVFQGMNRLPVESMARRFGTEYAIEASWIDSLLHSVIVVDVQSRDMPIVLINQAFTDLTGYGSDEAIGQNCRFLQGADRLTARSVVVESYDRRKAVEKLADARDRLGNLKRQQLPAPDPDAF